MFGADTNGENGRTPRRYLNYWSQVYGFPVARRCGAPPVSPRQRTPLVTSRISTRNQIAERLPLR